MLNLRIIFFFIGILITTLGISMLVPFLFEVYNSANNIKTFISCSFFTLLVGISILIAFRTEEKKVNIKDTIVITTLSWPVLVLFSSLPFFYGTEVKDFSEAFFEATSGLTTTGASIYNNVESLSIGILIWRSMLQWIGGIGIIVFAISIIPILNTGGMKLFTQNWIEKPEELHYRPKELVKSLGFIYIFFTILIFLLLSISGLSIFDSLCHAMTTVATGGFSTHNNSVGYYNNFFTEIIIVIGMLLASLPFTLYISFLRKKYSIFNDSQVLLFLSLITIFILALAIWIHIENNLDILIALRLALFNGISVMTGTGFSTENFSNWGSFSNTLLLTMMFIGGCSGSTTGGLKIFRIQILFLIIIKELKTIRSPRSITSINYKNDYINDQVINSVMLIILCFIASIFIITSLFTYYGYDFITSISAAITSVFVVGPGLGNIIGPSESFTQLPNILKYTLSIGMIVGRLEFLTFLIILVPKFWTK